MANFRVRPLLLSYIFTFLLSPFLFAGLAGGVGDQQCIYPTDPTRQQNRVCLSENREPALYTQDFGDCQGDSLIKVTQFNGAYYQDNMTVTWNLQGETSIENDSVMRMCTFPSHQELPAWCELTAPVYISVYAYGRNRIGLTVDPCFANIDR
jgi:hypothetical protein